MRPHPTYQHGADYTMAESFPFWWTFHLRGQINRSLNWKKSVLIHIIYFLLCVRTLVQNILSVQSSLDPPQLGPEDNICQLDSECNSRGESCCWITVWTMKRRSQSATSANSALINTQRSRSSPRAVRLTDWLTGDVERQTVMTGRRKREAWGEAEGAEGRCVYA